MTNNAGNTYADTKEDANADADADVDIDKDKAQLHNKLQEKKIKKLRALLLAHYEELTDGQTGVPHATPASATASN